MYYNSWYRTRKKAKKKSQSGAPRAAYGQTWWGEQWLNALANIDFDNRLPRGRAYAGNGSVLETNIIGNNIRARVEGSSPRPYSITISVPLFTLEQKKKLVSGIKQDPFFLSKLLNRELPWELHRLAMDQGIRLLPSSWKDFIMDCSCPDWAVPCKHLAAVIYVISREIDANPFLVLQLHGLDLMDELKNEVAGLTSHQEELIPAVESMLVNKVPETDCKPDFSDAGLPDFSKIPVGGSTLLSLIPSKPLFYHKDFREALQTAYKNLGKAMQKRVPVNMIKELETVAARLSSFDDTWVLVNSDFSVDAVELVINGNDNQEVRISFSDLDALLECLDPVHLANSNDALQGIAIHRQFAMALAVNGAIIPQILTGKAGMMIRWIPAVNETGLRVLTEKVKAFANPGTVWIRSLGKKKVYFPLNPEENSIMLTSLFLNHYMGAYSGFDRLIEKNGNRIPDMFFRQTPAFFNEPGEKHIPNTIQLWLKRLHLGKKQWISMLRVEERKGWFYLDILITNRETPLEVPVPLEMFLNEQEFAPVRYDLLRDLTGLADIFPGIGFYIQKQGKQSIQFNSNEFVDVFMRILPMLRLLGIEMLMPRALEKLLSPRPSLRITAGAKGKTLSFVNLEQLLGFEYQVALGDMLVSVAEFRKLVGRLSGIVKIKDQYVLISNDHLEKMFAQIDKPVGLSAHELLKTALAEEFQGAKVELSPEIRKLIAGISSSSKISLPGNLIATLRPYQLSGYRWIVQNASIGFGSLIADDMGLGKTVQVIAAILKFKQDGKLEKSKVLVIVPTTLLTNWLKEIEKFAPTLHPMIYHGASRQLITDGIDLLITTYGMIRSDLAKFKAKEWYAVVIDEAQNIKNSSTDQTKAVRGLKTSIRIAMSGTPVENRLSEYRSIMDFVNPGYLGSEKAFETEFSTPIQVNHDQDKAALFRKITAPFILRRLKSDKTIISDLPDKIEINHYCSLGKEQAALYQNVVSSAIEDIEQLDGIQRRGMVLKMITALKQICNHPDNFLKKGSADPAQSGKSLMLVGLLTQIHDAGEKTLIFTQYKEMGDILVKMVEKQFGMAPLFLHGGTTRPRRDALVEEFQNRRSKWIFILSLKAGGTGLNLTAASHVIHHDLWWNPAVEAQATDRAYRIGQAKNVMVNRLLTRGTFEEKIDDMLKSKKNLASLTVASGEKWIGDLSNKELKEVFSLP
ncbi:MAG: SNF2-related protein [Bacteroidetes bacterium]|nr:SNF2-related protein [Bacteroidota bacterium]